MCGPPDRQATADARKNEPVLRIYHLRENGVPSPKTCSPVHRSLKPKQHLENFQLEMC